VVGAWVVEVDGSLHERETEGGAIEVERALRAAGDERDVMQAERMERHHGNLWVERWWSAHRRRVIYLTTEIKCQVKVLELTRNACPLLAWDDYGAG
jgi:hypothetical protein